MHSAATTYQLELLLEREARRKMDAASAVTSLVHGPRPSARPVPPARSSGWVAIAQRRIEYGVDGSAQHPLPLQVVRFHLGHLAGLTTDNWHQVRHDTGSAEFLEVRLFVKASFDIRYHAPN